MWADPQSTWRPLTCLFARLQPKGGYCCKWDVFHRRILTQTIDILELLADAPLSLSQANYLCSGQKIIQPATRTMQTIEMNGAIARCVCMYVCTTALASKRAMPCQGAPLTVLEKARPNQGRDAFMPLCQVIIIHLVSTPPPAALTALLEKYQSAWSSTLWCAYMAADILGFDCEDGAGNSNLLASHSTLVILCTMHACESLPSACRQPDATAHQDEGCFLKPIRVELRTWRCRMLTNFERNPAPAPSLVDEQPYLNTV